LSRISANFKIGAKQGLVGGITGPPARQARRLAAIFVADVAGYSRMMNIDEVGTIRTLSAYREIMDCKIHEYGGRIANTAGDSVLAGFPSVVDAVECASRDSKTVGEITANISLDAVVQFRIEIHIGDVILRGTVRKRRPSLTFRLTL
jgi:adenylate cyclase